MGLLAAGCSEAARAASEDIAVGAVGRGAFACSLPILEDVLTVSAFPPALAWTATRSVVGTLVATGIGAVGGVTLGGFLDFVLRGFCDRIGVNRLVGVSDGVAASEVIA
jgi:hypothetical protein